MTLSGARARSAATRARSRVADAEADRGAARITGMRVGVIDVGANTFRLLVASPPAQRSVRSARSARTSGSARRSCITVASGPRSSRRWRRSPAARRIARKLGVRELETVVTAPGRQGDERRAPARHDRPRHHGRRPRRHGRGGGSPRLAGAVSRASPGENVVAVCDVGGGSTEIVVGTELLGPAWVRSVDLGSLRLTAALLPSDPPAAEEIERRSRPFATRSPPSCPPRPEIALAAGGSARTVARIVGHEYGPTISISSSRSSPAGAPPPAPRSSASRPERAAPSSPAPSSWQRSRASSTCRSAVARRFREGAAFRAGGPPARRLEHFVEQLDVALVREQRPASRGQPAEVVDLPGPARTPRERRHRHQRTGFGRALRVP